MKTRFYWSSVLLVVLCIQFYSSWGLSWGRHDLLTTEILKKVEWLNTYPPVKVASFDQFLKKAFANNFSEADFLKTYKLNPTFHVKELESEPVGSLVNVVQILISHVDEPDWGMDQDLDISADQKFMGGTKGPTSQAFRHLYWKKWSVKAPWRTFHIPPREMGEALQKAQTYYDLAEMAFKAHEPYWAFRFLGWSLHYIQDLGQPFHSSQLLTPKFIAWDSIFHFSQLIKRTTQIISNYHFIYEDYVVYRIEKELQDQNQLFFIPALARNDFMESSSAFLIAKHSADTSNRLSYSIGEACYAFFGKQFLDPTVDVPHSPKGMFKMAEFDTTTRLTQKEKEEFLKNTAKSLEKTGFFTRSLLNLAKEEFLHF